MRRNWPFVFALTAFLACAAIYFTAAHESARAGEDSPAFSVRRHDPYGCAALRELLAARGAEVGTLERSLPPAGFAGTIARVGPEVFAKDKENPPAIQTKATLDWVKGGGRLVVFAATGDALLEKAFELPADATGDGGSEQAADSPEKSKETDKEKSGEKARTKGKGTAGLPAKAAIPSALSASSGDVAWRDRLRAGMAEGAHPRVLVPAPVSVTWTADGAKVFGSHPPPKELALAAPLDLPSTFEGWTVLATRRTAKDTEVPVAGVLHWGKGDIVVVGDPIPATNFGLGNEGDLHLVLALLDRGDPVLFDEYSHGLGAADRVMRLIARFGLLPLLLQGVVLAGLGVWSTAGNPRRAFAPRPVRPRPASDQVVVLGHLLSRSRSAQSLVARVPALVRRRFAKALRTPPSALDHVLAAKGGKEELRLRARALLVRAAAAARASRPETEAIHLLSESHDLSKELIHESSNRA